MSLRNIMGLTVPKGRVALTWFNEYSGTVIKTPTSTLIFDPVGIRSSDVPRADAIVITHEHVDHFEGGLTRDIQRQTGATVVTTPFVAEQLRAVPSEKLRALRAGKVITIGNVQLNTMPSDHPGNQPLTFMITTEDNIRIYHSSDSRPFSEMKRIGEKYKPDIAFCTVDMAPGTSPRSGAEVARLVQPKVAIPYHTDRGSPLQEFAAILKREAPQITAKILQRFEVYKYPE